MKTQMTVLAKSRVSVVLVSVLILSFLVSTGPPVGVHGITQGYSQVYISPVKTCCSHGNQTYGVNEIFSVDVNLDLLSGEAFNGFDVRVNYTNPHSGISQGVLRAASIDYSTNIFSGYGNTVLEQCIDGIAVSNGNPSGCTADVLGQVHFGEFVLGRTFSGPLTGRLFSATFQVTGSGNSTFVVDTANIVNPTPDASNPGLISPQSIPVITKAAVFGNSGVIAFFDYQPDYPQDTMVSPSLLPNQPASFDASNSFVANDSSMGFRSYHWSFGDNNIPNANVSIISHTFLLPGNYTVALTLTDKKGEMGSFSRRVHVAPALGNLALTVQDQGGTLQRGNVQIRVFNSSSSPTPFLNQTTDGNGKSNFNRLIPGDYYLTFSGPGIVSSSKIETAIPGFTRQDTVNISHVPTPPDYSGLIYLGTILGGLAIITGLIVYQRSKYSRRSRKARGLSAVKSKKM